MVLQHKQAEHFWRKYSKYPGAPVQTLLLNLCVALRGKAGKEIEMDKLSAKQWWKS